MEKLVSHLTSITPNAGSSPCRRLVAITLCGVLVLGSILPGVAFASEADSEGEGTSSPIEAPIPPDFDPGGEEPSGEAAPAVGGGEEGGGGGEVEPEWDAVPEVAAEAPGPPAAGDPQSEEHTSELQSHV